MGSHFTAVGFAFSAFALLSSATLATASPDCDKALVPSTVQKDILSVSDILLASTITEETYNRHKQGATADAAIFGVPIGGSWNEFQESLRTYKRTFDYSRYDKFTSAYRESRLEPSTLAAYRYCLTRSNGLGHSVEDIGDNFYVVSLNYTPTLDVPSKEKLVEVTISENLKPESVAFVRDQLAKADFFGRRVELTFALTPIDRNSDSALGIKVGNSSQTLRLPSLEQPVIVKETIETPVDKALVVSAGGGRSEYDHGNLCIHPTKRNGKLLPKTATVLVTGNAPNATYTFDSGNTPERVCINVQLHWSSAQHTRSWGGRLSVTEVFETKSDLNRRADLR